MATPDHRHPSPARHLSSAELEPQVERGLSLKEGLAKIQELVAERLRDADHPLVVAVGGGSGSGKSHATDLLERRYGSDMLRLPMDNYFIGRRAMAEKLGADQAGNFDHPGAVELGLVCQHLEQLKLGQSVEMPLYSFHSGEREGMQVVEPKPIIVMEGLYPLHETVVSATDLKTFFHVTSHGQVMRRILRDIKRTGQRPHEILEQIVETVQPMHQRYVEPTHAQAEVVISNDYNPRNEAERSGTWDDQVKYVGTVKEGPFWQQKAREVGRSIQTDRFYKPGDVDFDRTNEILRVRSEVDRGQLELTYKYSDPQRGPQRATLSFRIDAELERQMHSIYQPSDIRIIKERVTHRIGDVLIHTDRDVKKGKSGQIRDLGTFTEVRWPDYWQDDRKTEMLGELGLLSVRRIEQSYYAM